MKLEDLNEVARAMARLDARISSLLEEPLRRDLGRACWLIEECRAYAVALDDARHMPHERAKPYMEEAKARLLQSVAGL